MGREKIKDAKDEQDKRVADGKTVSRDEPVKSSEVGGDVDELPAE